jgi:hypothetical protein
MYVASSDLGLELELLDLRSVCSQCWETPKFDPSVDIRVAVVASNRSVGNMESVCPQIILQVNNRAIFVGDSCFSQCQQLILFGKSAP